MCSQCVSLSFLALVLLVDEVALDVEVCEEDEEEDHDGGGEEGELPGVVALHRAEDDDEGAGEEGDELEHLEGRQVLLPPQVPVKDECKNEFRLILGFTVFIRLKFPDHRIGHYLSFSVT